MSVLRVDPAAPDPEVLARAAAVLRAGGLVAFPTETVYGLGANALDAEAVAGIFAAKQRPAYNPLIAHVADAAAARALVRRWPRAAQALAEAFWPGPLTLVLPRAAVVPEVVSAGLPTVAVRVPAHPVAQALLRAADLPVAAPSANRFTQVSPTTAQHVQKSLGARVDLVLDGGPTEVGIESTVLDVSGERPVLLRPGSLPLEAIEARVGPVAAAAALHGAAARPSPGMVERHYSPRAALRVFEPGQRSDLRGAARAARESGRVVGGLLLGPAPPEVAHPIGMPGDPRGYARELYAALHALDDAGCDLIVADQVPGSAAWAGIRDRLRRAAHPG